jgi:hypothetical protein
VVPRAPRRFNERLRAIVLGVPRRAGALALAHAGRFTK